MDRCLLFIYIRMVPRHALQEKYLFRTGTTKCRPINQQPGTKSGSSAKQPFINRSSNFYRLRRFPDMLCMTRWFQDPDIPRAGRGGRAHDGAAGRTSGQGRTGRRRVGPPRKQLSFLPPKASNTGSQERSALAVPVIIRSSIARCVPRFCLIT